jgi:hypothetical protein
MQSDKNISKKLHLLIGVFLFFEGKYVVNMMKCVKKTSSRRYCEIPRRRYEKNFEVDK